VSKFVLLTKLGRLVPLLTTNKRQQIETLSTANDGTLFVAHFDYNKVGLGKLSFKYFIFPGIIVNKHHDFPATDRSAL